MSQIDNAPEAPPIAAEPAAPEAPPVADPAPPAETAAPVAPDAADPAPEQAAPAEPQFTSDGEPLVEVTLAYNVAFDVNGQCYRYPAGVQLMPVSKYETLGQTHYADAIVKSE